jgi:hypothetical protein
MDKRLTAERLNDPQMRDALRGVIAADCIASGLTVETRDGVTTATARDGIVHTVALRPDGLHFAPPLKDRRLAAE